MNQDIMIIYNYQSGPRLFHITMIIIMIIVIIICPWCMSTGCRVNLDRHTLDALLALLDLVDLVPSLAFARAGGPKNRTIFTRRIGIHHFPREGLVYPITCSQVFLRLGECCDNTVGTRQRLPGCLLPLGLPGRDRVSLV